MFKRLLKQLPKITLFFLVSSAAAQSTLPVSFAVSPHAFPLVASGKAAVFCVDDGEPKVVHIAATALAGDIKLVTGALPIIAGGSSLIGASTARQCYGPGNVAPYPVIIGTISQSSLLRRLISEKKLQVDSIRGKWEAFQITTVDDPFPGVRQALCIIGSDPRGAAFGVFELSRRIGVHPFNWWADINPQQHTSIYLQKVNAIFGSPSVKYRGIFLNDEDWGLHPWAATKMDTAIRDIGPHTYARIFELLLRLKANYIWPAMHPCTKAFYYYKDDGRLAADYDIVVGTSHCEPMMRNNVFEWAENYKNEYHQDPGPWRYDQNKDQIYSYWEDRIKEVKNFPVVVTVGMRGIHDGSMPGPKKMEDKVRLLGQIINDQRSILSGNEGRRAEDIPQIFCPYKEVLDVYDAGLQLPDDITIVWSDDNHGYIRQLSDPKEQRRSGGSGIYYHLSYWGRPQDYLWLSTQSPALISYEMSKAYTYTAGKLWVFNVGDIKPAEEEIQFSMDLAWDIHRWNPAAAYGYTEQWAAEIFGKELAAPIAHIKNDYYRLAASGRPEHLGRITYRPTEALQRIRDYQAIMRQAEAIEKKIPARLKDAYFELILYPVSAACRMNEKILFARHSFDVPPSAAPAYSDSARQAFAAIQQLTDRYNLHTAGGKWNGIMSWHPRDLEVFKMPPTATAPLPQHPPGPSSPHTRSATDTLWVTHLPATATTATHAAAGTTLTTIPGLGIGGQGMTVLPLDAPNTDDAGILTASRMTYQLKLDTGNYILQIRCLPAHDLYKGREARYAISIDGQPPHIEHIDAPADTAPWDKIVVNGFVGRDYPLLVHRAGATAVTLYLPGPGVVISSLEVYKLK